MSYLSGLSGDGDAKVQTVAPVGHDEGDEEEEEVEEQKNGAEQL